LSALFVCRAHASDGAAASICAIAVRTIHFPVTIVVDPIAAGRLAVLIDLAVTIVIDAIANGVISVCGRRDAHVDDPALDAGRHSRRGARAGAARGGKRHIVLVRGPTAIVIDAVACRIIAFSDGRNTAIDHATKETPRLSGRGAFTETAVRRARNKVVVHKPVTIIVETVASGVGCCGRASFAGVDDDSMNAGRTPGRGTRTDPARRAQRHVVLVGRTVTVIVDVIARRVSCRRDSRRT
jgi:hypothetical protein